MGRRYRFPKIPPLAYALIVLFIIILVATAVPPVRETIIEFLNAIFGK